MSGEKESTMVSKHQPSQEEWEEGEILAIQRQADLLRVIAWSVLSSLLLLGLIFLLL